MCLSDIRDCEACGLCKNQKPLLDSIESCDGFWIGLSAKITKDADERPLDPSTKSGTLLSEFESMFETLNMYRTNLVKCAPLDRKGKLRYPNKREINACLGNLDREIEELDPKVIILLGKKVEEAVGSHFSIEFEEWGDFSYKCEVANGRYFLSVHHPSYIQVYKRAFISEYIQGIRDSLTHCL